ncbi:MAG: sigma-70 family RNA polymerase sigma factor [bacterium]
MELPLTAAGVDEQHSDEALMLRFAQGDEAAFDLLFHRHKNTVYAFIRKFIVSQEQADDLFQNVFLRVIRYRERYQPDARFSTWLFTITRSVCIDTIRRTSKIPPVMSFETSKPEGVSFTETLTAAQMTPRDHLHEDDLQRKIDRTLQTLPEEQREVLLLRELTDLTFAEIARITGCSINTAKSRMHYALLALRRGLMEQGITEP